jgi:putative transposase
MARLKRLVAVGLAHHIVQRAVAGSEAFVDDADRLAFVAALRRAATEHAVAVHAYVLWVDEVQILATPAQADALSRLMQSLARWYVAPFNRRHGRSGALWQSRFRAAPVQPGAPLLMCMRYIEQLPMRSGAASAPAEFPWSSAAQHAGLKAPGDMAGVPADSAYWRLGNTPFEREAAYRRLLDQPLPPADVALVEATSHKGWALGAGEFLASLAAVSDRPVTPQPRGRPRKSF